MNLTVERDALVDALAFVGRQVKPSKIPMWCSVLLRASSDTLFLAGHQQECWSGATIPAQVETGGSWALPASDLSALAKALPKGSHIKIKVSGPMAAVSCGRSRYQLGVLSGEDFPELFAPKDAASVDLDGAAVARLFGVPAAAPDPGHPQIFKQGACLQFCDTRIRSLASDGLKLIAVSAPIKARAPTIFVHKSKLDDILAIGKAGCRLDISDTLLSCAVGGRTFTTKLLDAKPINYDRIIPPADGSYIECDRGDLTAAIQRLQITGGTINFVWGAEPAELRLVTRGEAGSEVVPCSGIGITAGNISAPAAQLLTLLNAASSEMIRLASPDASQPLRLVAPSDADLILVQMPCRADINIAQAA